MTGSDGVFDAALAAVSTWGAPHHSVAIVDASGAVVATEGDTARSFRLASISKLLAGYAGLIALEEGTITLDDPAGPPGATVRHLLAHASGLGFDEPRVLAKPGARRVYSNPGIEAFADHLAFEAGMPFAAYLHQAVFAPLGMTASVLKGSPAAHVHANVDDLVRFVRELWAPTLIARSTLDLALTEQFPGIAGVIPGLGRYDPCPWGLAFELKDGKQRHWTGTRNSPGTFGHFGGAGTFLWVDPAAGLAVVCLTDREFGEWALDAWPPFSDAILEAAAG